MTRECKADFQALHEYIHTYSIAHNLRETSFVESLKRMHKCYFSMITWNAEMEHNGSNFSKLYTDCTVDIQNRISESISDLGSSLFNWMNGGYKVARVMLRVAIENFVRALSAINDKDQLEEKNVYILFEKAEALPVFNSHEAIKTAFLQLHSDYKLLCEDAHTAKITNMERLSSLAGIPTFKKKKAVQAKDIWLRVSHNINLIFCLVFNKFYHQLHHRNKENILHSFNQKMKPLVTGIYSS